MIEGRPYYGTDYEMVSGWWKGHGFPAVPEAFLPVNGVIIEIDGVPSAVGWLKLEASTPIAMAEWMVTNPAIPARKASSALDEVMEYLSGMTKAMGRTVLFTTCRQDSLARKFEKHGFQRTDSGMIHLIRNL